MLYRDVRGVVPEYRENIDLTNSNAWTRKFDSFIAFQIPFLFYCSIVVPQKKKKRAYVFLSLEVLAFERQDCGTLEWPHASQDYWPKKKEKTPAPWFRPSSSQLTTAADALFAGEIGCAFSFSPSSASFFIKLSPASFSAFRKPIARDTVIMLTSSSENRSTNTDRSECLLTWNSRFGGPVDDTWRNVTLRFKQERQAKEISNA